MEEDDARPSGEYVSWRHWLRLQGLPDLQPARWLYLNYTHQQVQAALAGQGLALARLPMTVEAIERGDLAEPFAHLEGTRTPSPYAYWLVAADPAARSPDVQRFCAWLAEQGAATREAMRRLGAG